MPHTKPVELTTRDHQQDIEEAAYYKWLNRGRAGGDPQTDWIEAELEFQTNLYSDDDEVERSLVSVASYLGEQQALSTPDRHKGSGKSRMSKPAMNQQTANKAVVPTPLTTTSDQTAMATQQDNT
jgi:hypothetical protein